MRRLTSAFAHVLPAVAALGLLVTAPALAQTTPPPTFQPTAVAPTPAQGRQPGQGQQGQPGRGQQGQQGQQGGQATTPPAAAPRAETPRAPSIGTATNQPMGPATNIRFELTITDTLSGVPVKKNVSWLVLNGNSGMIRTTNASTGYNAFINVDAVATAYQNGQVSTRITFEYSPGPSKDGTSGGTRPPSLNESITVVLQDGKPMVLSQSADPVTDRKVTAELTATILK